MTVRRTDRGTRLLVGAVVLGSALVVSAGAWAAVGEVDQSCTSGNGTRQIKHFFEMGQEFVPTVSTHLAVDLKLSAINPHHLPNTLKVRLREDDMDGNIVTGSEVELVPPLRPGWTRFMFPMPIELDTDDRTYVIEALTSTVRWGWTFAGGDCYDPGWCYVFSGTEEGSDHAFRTIVFERVDQRCETPTGDRNVFSSMPIGQEFMPETSEHAGLELHIRDTGGALGALSVKIHEDTIDGAVVDGSTVTLVPPPGQDGWFTFPFDSEVTLTVGETYVIEATTDDTIWSWSWSDDESCYPSGTAIANGVAAEGDQCFRTLSTLNSVPPVPVVCEADINQDGLVGFSDLTILLSAWGPVVADLQEGWSADLDGQPGDPSPMVGFSDLTLLLSAWGPCTP